MYAVLLQNFPQISKKFLQRFYSHRCFHDDDAAPDHDDENYTNEDDLRIMLMMIIAEADDDNCDWQRSVGSMFSKKLRKFAINMLITMQIKTMITMMLFSGNDDIHDDHDGKMQ